MLLKLLVKAKRINLTGSKSIGNKNSCPILSRSRSSCVRASPVAPPDGLITSWFGRVKSHSEKFPSGFGVSPLVHTSKFLTSE